MIQKSAVIPSASIRTDIAALALAAAAVGFLLFTPAMRGDPIVPVQGPAHGNSVNVAAVASISLSGHGNEVADQKAVDGEKPQITSAGQDNVAAKKKVE
jgi:hypothetical protein